MLTLFCQFERNGLRSCAPVYGCNESLALVPQTEERERRGRSVEPVVIAVEERALLTSEVAEGNEPLPYIDTLLPLGLKVWQIRILG